jgi:hypothetical protein
MRDSTVLKAVLASLIVLGTSIPMGHAQAIFFGMMSEQTPTIYNSHPQEITRERAEEMFKAMDADQNGVVTADEFSAAHNDFFPDEPGKIAARRFKALDVMKNGKVTKEEFIANRNVPLDDRYTLALGPRGAREDESE